MRRPSEEAGRSRTSRSMSDEPVDVEPVDVEPVDSMLVAAGGSWTPGLLCLHLRTVQLAGGLCGW